MAEEQSSPQTVFVAESAAVAEAVVQLLAGSGIVAEIIAPAVHAEAQPITGLTELVPTGQFEVRVNDPAAAATARELLDSALAAAALQAARRKRAQRSGTISAVCEECGRSSDWPASAMGTTENCPHCAAYMDIPDPEEDWSGVDFGQPEDDGPSPPTDES